MLSLCFEIMLITSSISVVPGCYGKLMGMWECPRGMYPVTMVFLDMLLTLIKAHWEEKWSSHDLLAGVCLTAQDIYSNQHKWRFTSVYDQQLIGDHCNMTKYRGISLKGLPKLRKLLN